MQKDAKLLCQDFNARLGENSALLSMRGDKLFSKNVVPIIFEFAGATRLTMG